MPRAAETEQETKQSSIRKCSKKMKRNICQQPGCSNKSNYVWEPARRKSVYKEEIRIAGRERSRK
jgi:hypothetical protein